MKVPLGNFARSGIEAELGADLSLGTRAALLHYKWRLSSRRPPPGPPGLFPVAPLSPEEDTLELEIGREMEAVLRSEAGRHRVSVEEILSHAVLVYLADMDAASQEDFGNVSMI